MKMDEAAIFDLGFLSFLKVRGFGCCVALCINFSLTGH